MTLLLPFKKFVMNNLYFTGGSYKEQNFMFRFLMSSLPTGVSVTDFAILDLEGVAYNWITRALVVCGGKQVSFHFL
jgi:hypothetical protein